jgi:chromosomal replication initiation ATPase DnaA
MDFRNFSRRTRSCANLYAMPYNHSIYSRHIHKLTEQCVTTVLGVTPAALRSRCRMAEISLGRQIAMYLAHVAFGLSLTQVGQLFGRDRTTVAHACSVVEDLRDDATLDRALTVLTLALAPPAPANPKP